MTNKNNLNKSPLVVIFGRTNVGKSTLFNCLTENKQAITSDIEGTTRDSNTNKAEWQGVEFELVDTGGIIDFIEKSNRKKWQPENELDYKVQQQAINYLKKADLVLFLTDAKTGLLPQDKQMADFLKKNLNKKKEEKVILVTNKVDNRKKYVDNIAEFNKLGLNEPCPVSAATGSGTGDLLDEIVNRLKKAKKSKKVEEKKDDIVSVCIIGKPNAGKSSIINSLLGYEKLIISDIPHTTREPQNTEITYKGNKINLVDTAGISRKGTKTKGLEKHGISKSLQALKKSDLALLVVDIKNGITHQDAKLVEEIMDRKKSFIIIANKWDAVEKKDTKYYTKYIYQKFPFAQWAPIQFISALTGKKVDKILDLVLHVYEQRQTEISDSALNKLLNKIVKIHKPAKGKGTKHPYIYEITQTKTNPPLFQLRIGAKDNLHFSYVRFVENKIREKFGFKGTPITIEVVKNRNIHGVRKK